MSFAARLFFFFGRSDALRSLLCKSDFTGEHAQNGLESPEAKGSRFFERSRTDV